MARRKRQFLDDGDDSDSAGSSNDGPLNVPGFEDVDADLQEERELFENPYNRKKRRKMNGRDDATYGVFADDSEDEGFGARKKPTAKRSDWAKAPSFVSGNKLEPTDVLDETKSDSNDIAGEEIDAEEEEEEDAEQDDTSEDESSDPKPLTPEPDAQTKKISTPKPSFGGLGFGKSVTLEAPLDATTAVATGFGGGGIGSGNAGVGSGRGGIGSSRVKMDTKEPSVDLPTAFGSQPQRAFVRDESPSSSSPRPAAPLSAADKLHFSKLQGSFGARMLAKMGWEAGTGLGAEGTGIVAPVETKLRPKNVGIAFKGFRERTAQAKAEARRRGEIVSDDEVEDTGRRKKGTGKVKKEQEVKADVWKKPKKTKTKIHHKTYEEIIAEAGAEAPPPGIGKIIDATGATLREVSSLADVSIASWTPTGDSMRIPEVRHNLRLIVDASKGDLDGLAREARSIEDRKKWIHDEDVRLRKRIADEAELIRRLQGVHIIVDDINTKAKEMDSSDYEADLSIFSGSIDRLLQEYPQEFNKYRLDEIVVGAISPSLRRMLSAWQPLQDPAAFTSLLERWKLALKTSEVEQHSETEIDIYGKSTVTIRKAMKTDTPMTPFDSFLWNVWMPKVRSSINNQWSPLQPQMAIQLFEAWSNIIPTFIRDNMLDQLILPKVSSTVASWNAKKDSVPLHSIVFPWLPYVGLRFDELMDDAKRKLKSMMRSWSPADGVPKDLMVWKDVFSSAEWENLFLKYVVPKLGALLREDFIVNPRDQQMAPLEQVLLWESIIRPSVFGQLLEMELFPKWLNVLYIWLIQPSPSFEEIAQWYSFWKGFLPTTVVNLSAVQEGFNRGLQMMSKAMELGPGRISKLPRPEHKRAAESRSGSPAAVAKDSPVTRPRPSRTQEITFRSIVEDYVSEHNLFFMPAGKVHEKSRLPLFRVSKAVDGKGGLLVYLLDDAVWAMDGDADEYRAIGLKDMVLRATKGHG